MRIKEGMRASLRREVAGWPRGTEVEIYFVPYVAPGRSHPNSVAVYFPNRDSAAVPVEALALPLYPDVVSV